jgi:hypothetical protein
VLWSLPDALTGVAASRSSRRTSRLPKLPASKSRPIQIPSRNTCGDPEVVQLPSNPLDAVAGSTPLQHHQPDANLLQVIRQEPHVVPQAPNLLSVLEPLDETVVGLVALVQAC